MYPTQMIKHTICVTIMCELSLMSHCFHIVQDFDVAAPENFIDEIENKIVQSMQIWSAPCFSGRISFSHV